MDRCLWGAAAVVRIVSCYTNYPLGAIARRKSGLGLHMYAEDAQLYISFKPVGGCELATEQIEACVTEMRSCMYNNKLQLNDAKTDRGHVDLFCPQPIKV